MSFFGQVLSVITLIFISFYLCLIYIYLFITFVTSLFPSLKTKVHVFLCKLLSLYIFDIFCHTIAHILSTSIYTFCLLMMEHVFCGARNYLELMVELPWNKTTPDSLDIAQAR